ncbi:Nucleoid-associated protein YbaB [Posidoniimonas corsicana]|uniref:Nucleoid-associated protein KOR34_22880 n=1 Tax=Posidoniimonas corsicana TaxID=1938618 RepID=A0A5C5VHB3_9BACT|nr:YbaB/EbfC family nucleoid-associated protein [Posidoniimonas corsicana]TWT37340.1 Nucleoid-associated protein YbaB [Posidoniimonas corsicana]
MLKGLGNIAGIMKQAQEFGGKMQGIQEQLKQVKVTGAAGGGLIEVDVNGQGEALAVRIDASLLEKQEKEMIEDLLPAAINDALGKAKQRQAEAMQEITGGLNLPGLEGLMPGGNA